MKKKLVFAPILTILYTLPIYARHSDNVLSEGFRFAPENFSIFIIGVIVSCIIGTSLLYNYKQSWLNFLNVLLFFICTAMFISEYSLQQAETYQQALIPHLFNGLVFHLFAIVGWVLMYYYINPFKKWRYKKQWDIFYGVCVIFIPSMITLYFILTHQIFELNTEKIDGLWAFKLRDTFAVSWHKVHTFTIMPGFNMFIFIYAVIFASKKMRRAIITTVTLAAMTIAVLGFYNIHIIGWQLSAAALPVLANVTIFTWYLLDYKLESIYKAASTDIFNSISDLLLRTDKNLNIQSQNDKVSNFFTETKGSIIDLIAKHSQLPKEDIQQSIEQLKNKEIPFYEMELKNEEGETRTFQIKVSEADWRGKQSGYSFLLSDLTTLKEKEKQLAQLNQTKDRIFGIIGHDLKKPAIAFRGITKKVNYLLKKKQYDRLLVLGESIEKDANALNLLTDNLLKWALLQRDILPNDATETDIQPIVEDVFSIFDRIAAEKNIRLTANIPPDHKALADKNALSTIIRNLVDNAVKFTAEGGEVSVSTTEIKGGILISVRDSGVGMHEDKIKDLFLLKKEKTTEGTEGEKGTGLGLHLVGELIKQSKGSVEVNSQIGEGTEFRITLPQAA